MVPFILCEEHFNYSSIKPSPIEMHLGLCFWHQYELSSRERGLDSHLYLSPLAAAVTDDDDDDDDDEDTKQRKEGGKEGRGTGTCY